MRAMATGVAEIIRVRPNPALPLDSSIDMLWQYEGIRKVYTGIDQSNLYFPDLFRLLFRFRGDDLAPQFR
jgi:hypothetical protein